METDLIVGIASIVLALLVQAVGIVWWLSKIAYKADQGYTTLGAVHEELTTLRVVVEHATTQTSALEDRVRLLEFHCIGGPAP